MIVKVDLLAEGPNKLKVDDKVRLRSGTTAVIRSTTNARSYSAGHQPIEGSGRNWDTDGLFWGNETSRHDIVGIIRPGRTELVTEDNEQTIIDARSNKAFFELSNG